MNKLFKQGIISLIEKENDHNENKLNMVTSENGLISNMKLIFIFEIYSSVAMLNKMINIEGFPIRIRKTTLFQYNRARNGITFSEAQQVSSLPSIKFCFPYCFTFLFWTEDTL